MAFHATMLVSVNSDRFVHRCNVYALQVLDDDESGPTFGGVVDARQALRKMLWSESFRDVAGGRDVAAEISKWWVRHGVSECMVRNVWNGMTWRERLGWMAWRAAGTLVPRFGDLWDVARQIDSWNDEVDKAAVMAGVPELRWLMPRLNDDVLMKMTDPRRCWKVGLRGHAACLKVPLPHWYDDERTW